MTTSYQTSHNRSIDRPQRAVDERQFQLVKNYQIGTTVVFEANVRADYFMQWIVAQAAESDQIRLGQMVHRFVHHINAECGGERLPTSRGEILTWRYLEGSTNLEGDVRGLRVCWREVAL